MSDSASLPTEGPAAVEPTASDVGLPPYSRQPQQDLDSLLAEYNRSQAQPRQPQISVQDTAAHLAEVQHRNQAQWAELQNWKQQWDDRLAEQQLVIDEHERTQQAVEMAENVAQVKAHY